MPGSAVVALGGNALVESGQLGTYREQCDHARAVAANIASMVAAGWRIVIVHGNGPQVGALALQQDAAKDIVATQPLFSLVAMTQGEIGSLLALALREQLPPEHPGAVCVGTHVVVDAADPAFGRPTKPIGPFVDRDSAARMAAERGWTMAEDSGRGYRRVVASPDPVGLLELDVIGGLVAAGHLVIAAGGGGIPVTLSPRGYRGVEAVVDKDLAAELLATRIGADALIIVTEVDAAAIHFGTARQRALHDVTVEEAERYAHDGQFPAGSMGPKMAAATRFVRNGGRMAVVTSAARMLATVVAPPGSDDAAMGTRILVGQPSRTV